MFGETDFDLDPYTLEEFPNRFTGRMGGLAQPVSQGYGAPPRMPWSPGYTLEDATRYSAPPTNAWYAKKIPGLTAGGITSLFKSIQGAIGTAQGASSAQQLTKMQAEYNKQAQQQANSQMVMSQFQPVQYAPSALSKYGVLLIVGAVLLVGGIVLYRRKR
jgi:hypothetical protein